MTQMRPRILVVDDDPAVLSLMRRGLRYAGYEPVLVEDGERALAVALEDPPDLIILDLMLPGLDGLEVCRRLRSDSPEPPVLMLTARDRVPDRVAGLDAGADDFLAKPFALDELLARIRALLRRTSTIDSPAREGSLTFLDLVVDPLTRGVRRGERHLQLTAREYDLLELFMRRPRQVLSRQAIVEAVWGTSFLGNTNMIEVHIMRLRSKLEAAGEPRLLHTLRGAGYSLREHEHASSLDA
jgi:two-component system response regulator MprA